MPDISAVDQLQIVARIMALEYLVKHLLWNQAVRIADETSGDDQTVARELELFAGSCEVDLAQSTVSSEDPAISDHVTGLVSESVRRLVGELLKERLGDRS